MVINLQRKRKQPQLRRTTRGRLDVRHRLKAGDYRGCRLYRAFLNGIEVTADCFYVDSRRGIVRLYVRDSGGIVIDPEMEDGALWVEKRGRVKLTKRKAAA